MLLIYPWKAVLSRGEDKMIFKSSFFIFPVLDPALTHLLPGCLGCWAPWQLPPSKLPPVMGWGSAGWGVWDGSTQPVVPGQLVAKEPCSPTELKQNKWSRMILRGPWGYRHVGILRTPHFLLLTKEREGGKGRTKRKIATGSWGGGKFLQDFLSLAAFLLARQPPEPWCLPLDGAEPSLRSPADQNAFSDVNIYTHKK